MYYRVMMIHPIWHNRRRQVTKNGPNGLKLQMQNNNIGSLQGDGDSNPYESLITNAKIMLVDDEPINTDVLQTYLEGEGYSNFITTSESVQAIEIMRREKPDVVLLDLMMPDVSGFDILNMMRNDKTLTYIPVVILTSSDDGETKLKALQLGAMDFLAKPVDASELALRLRNTLGAKAYQHHLVNFDQLTGLPKRETFMETIDSATIVMSSNNEKGAALHIYIDNLKNINSTMGHENGNKIIQTFARRLEASVRSAGSVQNAFDLDTQVNIARTGGDKFTVFLSPLQNPQQAAALARKIADDTSQPIKLDNRSMFTSAKIGIAIYPDDGDSVQTLFHNAETAMSYVRDHGGKENFTFYSSSMNEESARVLAIETGLQTAIEKNELRVTYQPKVDVQTGKIVGAEALVRWISGDLGFVGPDQFISIAERTGQIIPIGEWILKQACSQAAIWKDKFGFDFRIAVNMSIRQIHDSDMCATTKEALTESGLPANCLTLELTENMVMENAESNIELLRTLKSLGIKLSIDDFGTGYSSLSYLQRFPLDELKIDRSFIEEIKSENHRAPIVRAMVSLAHDLEMSVVAEGVETEMQLQHMRALECEVYQGYLRSKPIVADAFEALLELDYPNAQAA